MAQGVAWCARELGLPCTVVVPGHAPRTKLARSSASAARSSRCPSRPGGRRSGRARIPGLDGFFVHPFSDPAVMAGNGTIGLEIAEDLPDVDSVLVPYGGGGLICGIASALRACAPALQVFACEVETAAPLAPSLAAGEPAEVESRPSFVDGIGAPTVFPEMLAARATARGGLDRVGLDSEIAAARSGCWPSGTAWSPRARARRRSPRR